ncbi:MAG: multicopper oxidase domain-containing protein, partial [bacterium]
MKMNRREFLRTALTGVFVTSIGTALPVPLWSKGFTGGSNLRERGPRDRYDLEIGYQPMELDGRTEPVKATAINETVPGPLVHLKEGQRVQLNVTNALHDSNHSSIHWHGILVPFEMDGVPGVNFKGIPPGDT